MAPGGIRVAGIDLGKARARLVVGRWQDGRLAVERQEVVSHEGRPLEVFLDWYRDADLASCAALGATGLFSDRLAAPALGGLPEEACLDAAVRARAPDGPFLLVSVGARGYAALGRDADGAIRHLESDKCSSGTGENMVKLAQRFGMSIDEADHAATTADESIPITARCSVFAKSEMTHFANQGRPAAALLRGYFESVARYVNALVGRLRVSAPLHLIGGGSQLAALVDAFARLGHPVIVPDDALLLEALGAALLAGEQAQAERLPPLPADPQELLRPHRARIRVLAPARDSAARVRRLAAPPVAPAAIAGPTILGLDLGSTGSKAQLATLTGEPVLDVYDRTRGNPVDAAARLIEAVLAAGPVDVRAIGVTGSGREAVAAVVRAAFPAHADRIVVLNEIVAHATAAIRCDPDHGASLSVVEIGGQDAKFIQIAGGQIVESDLNKACSAGTGSFLEEQATLYGVDQIDHFDELAREASGPPELGQMCTVFVADAAAEAYRQGFALPDLFAGFQYSVILNYINRVLGQRTLGRRVFFQGKPATSESLAWTLAAVTGREVVVPANPGAMGAWGITLCAAEAIGADQLAAAPGLDLTAVLAAEVTERAGFRCQDKKCATLCTIDRTTVVVGDRREVVFSGGACPKYELAGVGKVKLPSDAPSAFDERERLLAARLETTPGKVTVGVVEAGAVWQHVVWLTELVRQLGGGVRVLRADAGSLARGEERCASYDSCAPAKISHALADSDGIDVLLFPKILDTADRDGPGGKTCPVEQAMPDVVEASLRARGRKTVVCKPVLRLAGGVAGEPLIDALQPLAGLLGASRSRLRRALAAAAAAQDGFDAELAAIGRRTLDYGRSQGIPVVTVCGMLHVVHDPVVNARIPALLRENGVLPLPMDCFPVPSATHQLPRALWADCNRALRVAVAARDDGDVYPLWLSSFGCGPSSFHEHCFAQLLAGHPHTILESDGHGGAAGYVTRIQAFLHAVRRHDRQGSAPPADAIRWLEPLDEPPIQSERDSRMVLFPIGDGLAATMAAAYRAYGYDVVVASETSAETLAAGRRDCSGKECLPYQLIWGSYRRHLEEHPPDKRTVLVDVTGDGACRNCMFTVRDQASLARLGLGDQVTVRHLSPQGRVHPTFTIRFWSAAVAWDLLHQLLAYHRALAPAGRLERIHRDACDRLQAEVSRPVSDGARGWLEQVQGWQRIGELLDDASTAYAALGASAAPGAARLRTVLLTGDIYLRLDDWGSDGLARRLGERGLRVIVEPLCLLMEYLSLERTSDLAGLPTHGPEAAVLRTSMPLMRSRLYRRVRRRHAWLPMPDARSMIDAARPLIDRLPRGEAPITVGSVLHNWAEGTCDGVVVVGPWGCGPALISEGLLRSRSDIPMLFVYNDGAPVDERRLNGFAYRLRREPARA